MIETLQDYNRRRQQEHHYADNSGQPTPNGIACPQCGREMLDSQPGVTLTSNPPQKNVHCPKCGYAGYRVA
jgi:ribosomal protein S27AE